MQEKRTKSRWIPVIVVMVCIFIHSALPADLSREESGWILEKLTALLHLTGDPEILIFFVRKAAHFLEYLALGLCLGRAVDRPLYAWLLGTGYAATDEWHQYFVPGRSCELRDIGIDAIGMLAGVLLIVLIRHGKEKRRERAELV